MSSDNRSIVTNFIEDIWNNNQFEKIDAYISPDFIDHSLPSALPANMEGMKSWIMGMGKSFEHRTVIEDMVCEHDKVMLKIRLQLKHIGVWREIEPTLSKISAVGYRYYQLSDGKIIAHWALLDGNSIEDQLRKTSKGCKIPL